MKIAHVIEGLELTSGVSLFCIEMCNRQAEAGHEVTLLYRCRYEFKPSDIVCVIQSPTLDALGERPDIVHIHGLWAQFNAMALFWCRKHKIPYVVSPHGCLMPRAMRNGKLKKWLFFHFVVKPLMRTASCLHVTAEAEKYACMKLGLECNYLVVPLGVTMPNVCVTDDKNGGGKTVLFLSRVSREKGVDVLLDAWKRLDATEWRLVVAGPSWRGYLEELERKIRDEQITGVIFVGTVTGLAKDEMYHRADVFVLPSSSENFGSVVIEALAAGVPVICTKGTPWKELEEHGCGWWVDIGVEPIYAALKEAMSLPQEKLRDMGRKGISLVEAKYTWKAVCDRIMDGYEKILDDSRKNGQP